MQETVKPPYNMNKQAAARRHFAFVVRGLAVNREEVANMICRDSPPEQDHDPHGVARDGLYLG